MRVVPRHRTLIVVGLVLAMRPISQAHQDPPGCDSSGVALSVRLLRADGTTGLVGSASECERVAYRVRLRKAAPAACAFSGGTLTLTTPDGVAHRLLENVPSVGGTSPETEMLETAPVPYAMRPRDAVNGTLKAIARYDGAVTHDAAGDTPGVAAQADRNVSIAWCGDGDPCTDDRCDPTKASAAACSNLPRCDDGDPLTTDACEGGRCSFTAIGTSDRLVCAAPPGTAATVAAADEGVRRSAGGRATGSDHAHPHAHDHPHPHEHPHPHDHPHPHAHTHPHEEPHAGVRH